MSRAARLWRHWIGPDCEFFWWLYYATGIGWAVVAVAEILSWRR